MLSLNSYGLPRSCTNQSSHSGGPVVLPRLSIGSPHARSSLSPFSPAPPRETRSLSKVELMRLPEHPLYRTTAGYDYGRFLEIPESSPRVPKHVRHAAFTQEFNTGPFKDTSLTSVDKSKQRTECWERKVEERTKLMKIKYEQLQEKLEVKKKERKREREARRRELERQHRAAVHIQARVRGVLVRNRLRRARLARVTKAAVMIQREFRSRALVKRAKAELQARRRQRLEVFVNKLQRSVKRFLLHREAAHQLNSRRRERLASVGKPSACDPRRRAYSRTMEAAVVLLQRFLRQHLRRRVQRTPSSRSPLSAAGDKDATDGIGGAGSGGGGGGLSTSGRSTKQTARFNPRRSIVAIKQQRRDKSQKRLNVV